MAVESHNGYYLYRYNPSIAGAVIFAILFAIVSILHFYRLLRTRTWFMLAFSIGGLFELVGYAARCSSRNNTASLTPYIIQSVLLLVAPALFAASVYMTLARLIRSIHASSLSFVPVKWITRIFVTGDVFSFFVQSGGAGIMAQGNKGSAKTGQNIILAGLFLQIILFAFFVITALLFQKRIHRNPTRESFDSNIPWKTTLHVLYGVSALILVRNIFRVVEYIGGQSGYLLGKEWTLYVFDSVMMVGVMVVFYVWYPDWIRNVVGEGDVAETGVGRGRSDDIEEGRDVQLVSGFGRSKS